jgi:hypothetical protein
MACSGPKNAAEIWNVSAETAVITTTLHPSTLSFRARAQASRLLSMKESAGLRAIRQVVAQVRPWGRVCLASEA